MMIKIKIYVLKVQKVLDLQLIPIFFEIIILIKNFNRSRR